MSLPLHSALIRLRNSRTNSVVGTGFLASGADGRLYALTCGHVANLAFDRNKTATEPLPPGKITADLLGRGEITLDLLDWRPPALSDRTTPLADIAVFTTSPALNPPFTPPLRLDPPSQVVPDGGRVQFTAFGFMGPSNHGLPTSGALTAVDSGGWFVADGDDGFRRFIEEGLSGAPVFANGTVLGMVVQRLEIDVKQGFVIPALTLARLCPPLARPYPGLPAFDRANTHLFFGRGRPDDPADAPTGKLKQICDALAERRLVGLMGASGSGKSSLARAGVATHYANHGWTVIVFRPGLNPAKELAAALADAMDRVVPGPDRISAIERWMERVEKGRLTFALDEARNTGARGTLIVVDQFEEFFTSSAPEVAQGRSAILPQLHALTDRDDVHCLLTGRLDLLETMVSGDAIAAKMLAGERNFVLTAMSQDELQEAIEGPARLFEVSFDSALVSALAAETTGGEGQLPLLQAALQRLWAGLRRDDRGWRIARDAARGSAASLLRDALGEHADVALRALRRTTATREGLGDEAFHRIFLDLVNLADGKPTRRLLKRQSVSTSDWRWLQEMADRRLVTIGGEDGAAELVHERLMQAWPFLAKLIEEETRFLAWRDRFWRELTTWRDKQQDDAFLLRSGDLPEALEWLADICQDRNPPGPEAADFIRRSQAKHEDERARLERLLHEAEAQRNAALLQESRALSALAQQESARGDHLTATLLALEALPSPSFGGDRPLSLGAAAALRQAWLRNRETALTGHTDRVISAAFSPDGTRVVTASWDNTARLWDLSGTRPVAILLEGHTDAVVSAVFSPDGRRVVTASDDETARMWDLSGARPVATVMKGHTIIVNSARFSPDGNRVVTASWDNTARVWDLSGAWPAAVVLEGHSDTVSSAEFSPDGTRVATASWDRTARVWDLSGVRPVATLLKGHTGAVVSAAFSSDGQRVVTASADQTARVWNLSGARPVATVLKGHTGGVASAAFSADGCHVVTASADQTARVWDLSGASPIVTMLEGHTGEVVSATFSPDGRRVVTASDDQTACVWDLSSARPVASTLEGHTGEVVSATFSPDGQRVVTASYDGTARVWSLSSAHPVATGHTGAVLSAAFSLDGRHVVTASADQTARVLDLSDACPGAIVLEGHTGEVNAAAFSPDGQHVVTASADQTARVWNLSGARQVVTVLEGHKGAVLSAAFSLDGQRVVTASADQTARVWDLSGARPVATVLEGHMGFVVSAALSPDGGRVVTASADRTARVWDLSAATAVATVLEHTSLVLSAAFSPDGRRVVTASTDRMARIWDLSGTRPVATVLEGHTGEVVSAAYSPDGRWMVTASFDLTARVWDLSGARPIAIALEGHTDWLRSATFSSDGKQVLTFDSVVRVWNVYPDIVDLSRLVVSRLSRCLTTAQRERFGLQVTDTAQPRDVITAPGPDGRCPN